MRPLSPQLVSALAIAILVTTQRVQAADDGNVAAASSASTSSQSAPESEGSSSSNDVAFNYYHLCDPAISAIFAWLVLVNVS